MALPAASTIISAVPATMPCSSGRYSAPNGKLEMSRLTVTLTMRMRSMDIRQPPSPGMPWNRLDYRAAAMGTNTTASIGH